MKTGIKYTAAYLLFLLLLIVLWGLFGTNTKILYPLESGLSISAFQDTLEGGSSSVVFFEKDSSLIAEILVRSGVPFPYAGVKLDLLPPGAALLGKGIDMTRYDSLSIEVSSFRTPGLLLTFLTADPERISSFSANPFSARFLQHPIKTSGNLKKTTIALSDFKVPEWWFARNHILYPDELKYWDRSFALLILNGSGTMLGIPDEFQIKRIEVFGVNRKWGICLILAAMAASFIYFRRIYLNDRFKNQTTGKTEKEN